jgi:hypothetical protein
MSYKEAYFLCNGGEFFSGIACALDGVQHRDSIQLTSIVKKLRTQGIDINLDSLHDAGMSLERLRFVIIIEFPGNGSHWKFFRPLTTTVCENCGSPQSPDSLLSVVSQID